MNERGDDPVQALLAQAIWEAGVLEVMTVVWRCDGATVDDICQGLVRPALRSTVSAMLSSLEHQGLVARDACSDEGVYRALVSLDEARHWLFPCLQELLLGCGGRGVGE